jgi:hypothetical protein
MIIIGHSLNALCYSYAEGIPLFSCGIKPHEFSEDLPLWNRLATHLAFRGLFPCQDNIDTLRIEDDNLAIVTTENSVTRIPYDKIIVFNDDKVAGLPPPIEKVQKELLVLDYIDLRFITKHNLDTIEDDEHDLVYKIQFYDNKKGKRLHAPGKDICCFTRVEEKKLYNVDYSEAYARLKALKMIKKAGVTGAKNGMDYKNNVQKYRAIKTEWMDRKVYELNNHIYSDTDKIKFPTEDYLNKAKQKCYNDLVAKMLGNPFEEESREAPCWSDTSNG